MDLGEAVRRHRPALVSFAFRMVRDAHEAEDAVQAGLARAVHAIREGVRPDNERAWLYKIVLRECQRVLDRKRIRNDHLPRLQAELLRSHRAEQVTEEEKAKLHRSVLGEVSRLSDVPRQVILLRFCQHLSVEEVAQVLEMPAGTVKSHQSRALQALQERMGSQLDGWV